MVRIMLDTNAVLDLVFNRYEQRHADMLAGVGRCDEDTHDLLVCAHSLVDMTYILENNAGMKAAIPDRSRRTECARFARETVFKFCTICAIDGKVCQEAHDDKLEPDFEDALVAACARMYKADVIVTSDERAFRASGLRVLRPAEFATCFFS